MVKRLISLLLISVMMLTLFSGCKVRTKADKSFSAPILDEPTSLDPQIADSNSEKTVVLNCFEGLLRVNDKGELEPGVAESYTVSADKLTYTFKLRSDAHWALFSGHKELLGENYDETFDINVYAEDFTFAFDRVSDEQINSPYKNTFSCIESYSDVDKHTFVIKLKYFDENFLYSLTYPGAMPCDRDFYELTRGRYGLDAKYLLCNGPFNVSKWIEGTSVRIVRNDDYNGVNKVKPTAVTFFINSSEEQIAEKMKSNTYDIAFLNRYNYDSLDNKDDYNAQSIENTVYSMVFNQANKYLANKNIRLAISYATDFANIAFDSQNSSRAVSIIPPFCKLGGKAYVNESYKSLLNPYDSAKAKSFFEQGLLELGESSVELDIKCTEEYENAIKQTVQNLQKNLGVKFIISVNTVKQSELSSILRDGNYSIIFYPYTVNSVFVRECFEEFADSNLFNYQSEEFNKLVNNMRLQSGNLNQLSELCRNAEKMIISDTVMLPVIYEKSYFITSDETDGIYFYSSESNIYFINATKK